MTTARPEPRIYYQDDSVTLWHGDMRDVLPLLDERPSAAVVDPPYGQTALAWDRWIPGWPALVAEVVDSMWCFGTLRMFMDHTAEYTAVGWRLSHDAVGGWEIDTAVWDKAAGTRPVSDRLIPVHELAGHFYRGRWDDVYLVPGREAAGQRRGGAVIHRTDRGEHQGTFHASTYVNGATRAVRSVIRARRVRGGISRTQKPLDVVSRLVESAVPPGGLVLDPTAGSCTTGVAAVQLGRRAVLIEADETQCEQGAQRLAAAATDLFTA